MGHLASPFKEISKLDFKPFPTRPTKIRVVRVDDDLFGVGERGAVYTTCDLSSKACFLMCTWRWLGIARRAFVKLGLVSDAVMEKHVRECEENEKVRRAQDTLEYYVPRLEEHGIKLTKRQLAKLKAQATW